MGGKFLYSQRQSLNLLFNQPAVLKTMKIFKLTLSLIATACALTAVQAQQNAAHEAHDALVGNNDAIEQLFSIADVSASAGSDPAAKGQRMGPWGFDMTGRDLTTKPGDDFFQWANGTWHARTEIPSDLTRYGNFDALRALSEERVRDLLSPES